MLAKPRVNDSIYSPTVQEKRYRYKGNKLLGGNKLWLKYKINIKQQIFYIKAASVGVIFKR